MTTPDLEGGDNAHRVAAADLKAFCERIERLEEEKKTIAEDIKSVKDEVKAAGYDKKVLAEMLKLRKMEDDERAEWEALRTTYCEALGVFG